MILTARGAEQHSTRHRHRAGLHQPRARPRAAGQAVLRLRHDHRPGQRPGRPRARPEGRPAARLPQARRPGRPGARRRRCGGSTRTSCPKPGLSAYEMLDRLGTDGGVRALLRDGLQHRGLGAGRQPGPRTGSRALDLLVVSDIFLSETAELADVVLPTAQWAEEEGTMTNLEGRVIRRRRALPPPRRRPRRPADAEARWPTGSAAGSTSPPTRSRCSTSCGGPAPAASPTTPASPTSGSTPSRASSGRAPAEDHPGTPRLFADALPDRRRPGAASSGSTAPRPAETPDAGLPVRADHRPADGAVPERAPRPGGCRARPSRSAEPEAQMHPDLARRAGHRERRHGRAAHPPRARPRFRAKVTDDIRPDTVFVPFHWGGASAANALTNPALDPHSRMPAFKACAVDLRRLGDPTTTTCCTRPPTPSTEHAAAHPTHAQPAAPTRLARKDTRMITQQPLPARDLPLRGGRPGQAGAAQRRADLRRARRRRSARRCTSAAATPPTS